MVYWGKERNRRCKGIKKFRTQNGHKCISIIHSLEFHFVLLTKIMRQGIRLKTIGHSSCSRKIYYQPIAFYK